MLKKIITITAVMIFGIVSLDSAAVITFDDLETPGNPSDSFANILSYENQNFKLETVNTACSFTYFYQNSPYYKSSAALTPLLYNDNIILTTTNESLFSINSIDLTTGAHGHDYFKVEFSGYDINDNLIATQEISAITDDWTTFEFSSAFNNLSYIEWNNQLYGEFQFDNIVLNEPGSPVPVPTTVLLLSSGILGMAITRRKKLFKQI